jgi:chemotaxis protein CheD
MTVEVGQAILVGLGQLHSTSEPGRLLVARSLGSTAALAVHDPVAQVGGLLHWMLPASCICPSRAERSPSLFADTGFPRLLDELEMMGAGRKRLRAALAGAASLPEGGEFDVGERNREMAHRLLQNYGIRLAMDQTGGVAVRELCLEVGAGEFIVRTLNV